MPLADLDRQLADQVQLADLISRDDPHGMRAALDRAMTRKNPRKLKLDAETVRSLDEVQLNRVAGGITFGGALCGGKTIWGGPCSNIDC